MSGIILKKKVTYLNIGERRYKHIEIIVDISATRTRKRQRLRNQQNQNNISAFIDLTNDDSSDNPVRTPLTTIPTISTITSPVYTSPVYSPYQVECTPSVSPSNSPTRFDPTTPEYMRSP